MPPLFNHLHEENFDTKTPLPKAQAPRLTQLKSRFIACSSSDAAPTVAHRLRVRLSQLLSMSSISLINYDIDIFQPLVNYGVDSLLGVELRDWIAIEFASDIAIFEIMSGASLIQIEASVVKSSR